MTTDAQVVLPESVAERLRVSVVAQQHAPGAAITESAVALRYGVARPTARLAIDRLVADGILRREAHRAARVPVLDGHDIADLFDTRSVVEAAAVATLRSVPPAAASANDALAASDGFAPHDAAFHRALVSGSRSSRLTRLHDQLMGEVELCIGQVQAARLLTATDVAAQHQGILDAVAAGDSRAAARLTADHIAAARDALLRHHQAASPRHEPGE